jgi:hypothetical protein
MLSMAIRVFYDFKRVHGLNPSLKFVKATTNKFFTEIFNFFDLILGRLIKICPII